MISRSTIRNGILKGPLQKFLIFSRERIRSIGVCGLVCSGGNIPKCGLYFHWVVVLGEMFQCSKVYCRPTLVWFPHFKTRERREERGERSGEQPGAVSHCGMSAQQDQLITMTKKIAPRCLLSSSSCRLQTVFISKLQDCRRLQLNEYLLLSQNIPGLHACKLIFSLTQFDAKIEVLQSV